MNENKYDEVMLTEGELLIGDVTKTDIPTDKHGMPIFEPIDLMENNMMTAQECAKEILIQSIKFLQSQTNNEEKYLRYAPQVFKMCVDYAQMV